MADSSSFEHITNQDQLEKFCSESSHCDFIGFDTEFVSENRYLPELCLLQVAADERYVIVDTLTVKDVTPFWELLVSGPHVTIAHAAREEFMFCFRAVGKHPQRLFDVQLAAGMISTDYPSSYGNLVSKMLGKQVDKGETRTDWARRPLTDRQMDYALQDVVHLLPLYKKINNRLNKLGRTDWVTSEMTAWQNTLEKTVTEPQWRRVSGISSLNSRALAIVKELWIWRDESAREKNRSARRVLPDDLIVELARRGSPDEKRLRAIRGFESRVSRDSITPIANAIQKAVDTPKDELPGRMQRNKTMNLGLLGQFLTTALNIVCRNENIAPPLVGTANEVRNMAAWRMGMLKLDQPPDLCKGWRAEIVGQLIDKVLDGSLSIRVGDPRSEQPLMIEGFERKSD
jgi:ribonuclease D